MENNRKSRKTFINLAVTDLNKSMEFFRKLGFTFNLQFTNEAGACMIISEEAYAMLLTRAFFQSFTPREICDTRTHTEAIIAISCDSREEVNQMVNTAIEAGGKHVKDPQDHGFMYGWSFYDLDGHNWEFFWMDPAHVLPQQA